MTKNTDKHNEQAAKAPQASESAGGADLDKILAEFKEYKDKYVRLYAELENTRKRHERERLEYQKYATQELLHEFLNILDDLERSVIAARSKHEDHQALLKGIELVMARIYEMLKRNGVKPIEAKGKKFDPHFHEILMQEETAQHEEGMVIEEFQKGYMIDDHVLRTAKVKIAKRIDKQNKTTHGTSDISEPQE